MEALHTLYADFGSELEPAARKAMQDYLAQKPRGKFGKHRYSVGAAQENARKRALFERYQQTFGVPDEI